MAWYRYPHDAGSLVDLAARTRWLKHATSGELLRLWRRFVPMTLDHDWISEILGSGPHLARSSRVLLEADCGPVCSFGGDMIGFSRQHPRATYSRVFPHEAGEAWITWLARLIGVSCPYCGAIDNGCPRDARGTPERRHAFPGLRHVWSGAETDEALCDSCHSSFRRFARRTGGDFTEWLAWRISKDAGALDRSRRSNRRRVDH